MDCLSNELDQPPRSYFIQVNDQERYSTLKKNWELTSTVKLFDKKCSEQSGFVKNEESDGAGSFTSFGRDRSHVIRLDSSTYHLQQSNYTDDFENMWI